MRLATNTPLADAWDSECVCHTAAIANDIQPFMPCLKILINRDFHIVELNFHAIKQRICISCTRSDLVQCIDHLNDTIKDSLRKDKAQISRCSDNVGTTRLSLIRFSVLLLPRIKSPKRCTITPPPNILERRAILSP